MNQLLAPRLSALRSDPGRVPYVALRLSAWSAVTALATFGALVVALLFVVGFDLDVFFHQLINLAGRFTAADAARQADMARQLTIGWASLFLLIGFLRRGSLLAVLREKGSLHD